MSFIECSEKPKDWKPYRIFEYDEAGKLLPQLITYWFKNGVEQGYNMIAHTNDVTKINTSTKGRDWGEEQLSKLKRV